MPLVAPIALTKHLKEVPAEVRPIVEAAVRTVKEVAPKADQVTYQTRRPRSNRTMWKLVRYAVAGEYVVGIGTFPGHSTVFFYRGRELDDGSGLLQGGGKDLRFITLRSRADAQRPAVKQLVRKAFKLAAAAAGAVRS